MSGPLQAIKEGLSARPRTWLVTGAAGFIGSHLVEHLLSAGQRVVGLDDFSTGHRSNLETVLGSDPASAGRFELIEGDIRDAATCARACRGVEVVLHQAALGSVPRSVKDPLSTHQVNVTGFINVLLAARDAGIRRVVYASSSSVYGDHPALPKREEEIGNPLSPYAVSKRSDELYASAFARAYGQELVGLRYFNVFGPRQDPNGPYAAVIPLWFAALLRGEPVFLNGDGETSRDFCYVENVVQANLLAATYPGVAPAGEVFNVAYGARTTLAELFRLVRAEVVRVRPSAATAEPVLRPFREGDVRHSLAALDRFRRVGYQPTHSVADGLTLAAAWYRLLAG